MYTNKHITCISIYICCILSKLGPKIFKKLGQVFVVVVLGPSFINDNKTLNAYFNLQNEWLGFVFASLSISRAVIELISVYPRYFFDNHFWLLICTSKCWYCLRKKKKVICSRFSNYMWWYDNNLYVWFLIKFSFLFIRDIIIA